MGSITGTENTEVENKAIKSIERWAKMEDQVECLDEWLHLPWYKRLFHKCQHGDT